LNRNLDHTKITDRKKKFELPIKIEKLKLATFTTTKDGNRQISHHNISKKKKKKKKIKIFKKKKKKKKKKKGGNFKK